jgi:hypothetical protein
MVPANEKNMRGFLALAAAKGHAKRIYKKGNCSKPEVDESHEWNLGA